MTVDIVLEDIKEICKKYKAKEVILFGSRARGDYHRTSDIDLAVKGGDTVRFSLDVDDCTSTLLSYDIVDLGGPVEPEWLASIKEEGQVIYEKV